MAVPAADGLARSASTWLSYAFLLLYGYLSAVLGPILPYLREHLGLSYTAASLHLSAFALGGVLAGLSSTAAERTLGRRGAVTGAGVGLAVGALLLSLGSMVALTLLGALLVGWLGMSVMVITLASLADEHGSGRAIALAEATAAISLGGMVVPLVVGGVEKVGLDWRWALFAAVGVAAMLLLLATRVSFAAAHPTASGSEAGAVPLPPHLWLLFSVLVLLTAAEWSIGFWAATYLHEVRGLSQASAALSVAVFYAAMLTGRVVGSLLARRRQATALLGVAMLVAAASFPLFWLGAPLAVAVAGLAILGLAAAVFYPMTIAVAIEYAPHAASRLSARATWMGSLAVLTAPAVLGALADAVGLFSALSSVLVFLILAAAVFAAWLPRARRDRHHA